MDDKQSAGYGRPAHNALRGLSLCSGYGGLDMAAEAVLDVEWVAFAEYDKHAAEVFSAHWPDLPNLHDITAIDWRDLDVVDLLTAGYPCQPFSTAGKRLGEKDERHLWPYIADAVRVLRPRYVLLENVAGHLRLGFDRVLADLAGLGFDAEWTVLRASEVGAPHARARLFVIAVNASVGGRGRTSGKLGGLGAAERSPCDRPAADSQDFGHERAWGARQRGTGLADGCESAANTASERRAEGGAEPDRGRLATSPQGAAADPESDPWWLRDGNGSPAPDAKGSWSADIAARSHDGVPPVGAITGAGDGDCQRRDAEGVGDLGRGTAFVAWGDYEPAIRRWERITGRPAPNPLDGRGRLNPRLSEWMMGLPDGWVTDHLPRSPALKCIGNGVVPQAAGSAFQHLLGRMEVAA